MSSSSSEGSHGLSAKSGIQRLRVFKATCCSALNEASPIKSDEALYIFLSVSLISLLCASISFAFHHENNTDEESLSVGTTLSGRCDKPSGGFDHVVDHVAFLQRQKLGPAIGQRNLVGYFSPDA